MPQKTFSVPARNIALMRAIFVILISLLLCIGIHSLINAHIEKSVIIFVIGVLSLLFVNWRILKRFPYMAVTLDDEGIWYEHLGRNHLVPWSQLTHVETKGNHFRLCDRDNNVKFKVNYPLENFDKLRDIIAKKIYTDTRSPRQIFSKTTKYQLANAGFFAIFLGIITIGFTTLLILFIIGMHIAENLITVIKVTISDGHFVLNFPFRKKIIPFTEIIDIRTIGKRSQDSGFFQIGIFVEGRRKPYCLTKLGIDDMQLLMILRQAAGIT